MPQLPRSRLGGGTETYSCCKRLFIRGIRRRLGAL